MIGWQTTDFVSKNLCILTLGSPSLAMIEIWARKERDMHIPGLHNLNSIKTAIRTGSGRPITVLTPEMLARVAEVLDLAAAADCQESGRNNLLGLAKTTWERACRHMLHYHPYHPRSLPRLYQGDREVCQKIITYDLRKQLKKI